MHDFSSIWLKLGRKLDFVKVYPPSKYFVSQWPLKVITAFVSFQSATLYYLAHLNPQDCIQRTFGNFCNKINHFNVLVLQSGVSCERCVNLSFVSSNSSPISTSSFSLSAGRQSELFVVSNSLISSGFVHF